MRFLTRFTRQLINREPATDFRLAHERLRLAMEAGRSVGWDWEVKTGRDIWFGDLNTMFGISADLHESRVEDFHKRVHPDDREMVGKAVAEARRARTLYHATFRVLRTDGTTRWVTANGRFYYDDNGEAIRMLGIAEDVTERVRAEEARRESEERFRAMADEAPVMLWMSGPDKLCNYFNRPWLEFTGRTIEAELGNGWADAVWPEDLNDCLKIYNEAFDRCEPFRMIYRLRRHDGAYRWILDTAVPRFSSDGSFAGYIGSGIDVTEQKLTNEALSGLSRRLMKAQECERASIAKELHDDLAQRMALLRFELEMLQQVSSRHDQSAEMHTRVRELCDRATDLGKDLQVLSERLHSFKLEYLGLVPVAEGFCREAGKHQGMTIDFRHSGVPHDLPKDVALCLFRVLQEAVMNAVQHAGVQQFKVILGASQHDIQLEVIDKGVGFDPEAAKGSRGLGLAGMQERIRLVNGKILIESGQGIGTTVKARVPLQLAS